MFLALLVFYPKTFVFKSKFFFSLLSDFLYTPKCDLTFPFPTSSLVVDSRKIHSRYICERIERKKLFFFWGKEKLDRNILIAFQCCCCCCFFGIFTHIHTHTCSSYTLSKKSILIRMKYLFWFQYCFGNNATFHLITFLNVSYVRCEVDVKRFLLAYNTKFSTNF